MEYPKRPRFFALRFSRLMIKVCLANEIGPEGCWMLSVIVGTEDAGGYRKPVTFWNGQLWPIVGCGSESSFKRLRDKVVASGWLAHIPGTRGKAPAYFVTVPETAQGLDDGPTDESNEVYSNGHSRSDSSSLVNQKPNGNRSQCDLETVQKADGNRTESERKAIYSPLSPIPNSFPYPSPKSDGEGGEESNKKRKELCDAICKACNVTYSVKVEPIADKLIGMDPPFTPAECDAFLGRYHECCDYSSAKTRQWPTLNEIADYGHRIRTLNGKPRNVHKPTDPKAFLPNISDESATEGIDVLMKLMEARKAKPETTETIQ